MRSDIMAYDIWIFIIDILKAMLDFEVWIEFFNSNHISQTASRLQIQYQLIKLEYKESFMRYKAR